MKKKKLTSLLDFTARALWTLAGSLSELLPKGSQKATAKFRKASERLPKGSAAFGKRFGS